MRRDAEAAAEIAAAAGRELLTVRETWNGQRSELRAAGDAAAQHVIAAELSTRFPDDAVRSEEAPDQPERSAASRVWIVDPLDGTREYAEGRTDWAVHVALWADGGLVAGAVALPGLDRTLVSAAPPSLAPRGGAHPRILVSRTRPSPLAEALRDALAGELVAMGSAGAKAMAVVRGAAEVYAHSGGQYEWDSAAPVAVARAAGLVCSRLDGRPLVYNQPDPWLPDLLICRPELAEAVSDVARRG